MPRTDVIEVTLYDEAPPELLKGAVDETYAAGRWVHMTGPDGLDGWSCIDPTDEGTVRRLGERVLQAVGIPSF